jgi:hypothetical protein
MQVHLIKIEPWTDNRTRSYHFRAVYNSLSERRPLSATVSSKCTKIIVVTACTNVSSADSDSVSNIGIRRTLVVQGMHAHRFTKMMTANVKGKREDRLRSRRSAPPTKPVFSSHLLHRRVLPHAALHHLLTSTKARAPTTVTRRDPRRPHAWGTWRCSRSNTRSTSTRRKGSAMQTTSARLAHGLATHE